MDGSPCVWSVLLNSIRFRFYSHLLWVFPWITLALAADAVTAVVAERGRGVVGAAAALLFRSKVQILVF